MSKHETEGHQRPQRKRTFLAGVLLGLSLSLVLTPLIPDQQILERTLEAAVLVASSVNAIWHMHLLEGRGGE